MTVVWLKLLALCTMTLDHLGILLSLRGSISPELYDLLRTIGRMAMPLYCFLLAESFRHLQKDDARLRRFGLRLLILALISEPVFDFFLMATPFTLRYQSVIVTLLLGFGAMWIGQLTRRPYLSAPAFVLAGALAWLLHTDYEAPGVLLIWLFWVYTQWGMERSWLARFLWLFGSILIYYGFYAWTHVNQGTPEMVLRFFRENWSRFLTHLALIPILTSYRGQRGPKYPLAHRIYQWYYPAHLALFCLVGRIL